MSLTGCSTTVVGEAVNRGERHAQDVMSISYPETSRKVVLSALQESELQVGRNAFRFFPLEQGEPGKTPYQTTNTPKAFGAVRYQRIFDVLVPVISPEPAMFNRRT